jgi:hypothetical protein
MSDFDSAAEDRDRALALVWEQIAYEQELADHPGLTLDEYREQHERDLEAYYARRDRDRQALIESRQADRREQGERWRILALQHPWATAKDLHQVDLILASARSGETWVDFVSRIHVIDERHRRLLEAIFVREETDSAG